MLDSGARADERVRALAEEVLARPEYREYRRAPTELQELVGRFAAWLDQHLGWLPDRFESNWEYLKDLLIGLFDGVFADGPLAVLLRFALAAVVLAAVAAIGVAIVRALRGRLGGGVARDGDAPAARSARGLLVEAEELAGDGRFLEAAHCVQLATLELLLRREWISLSRSDPNRTLRRRVDTARLPGAERAEFLALVDRLERRWFRDRQEDSDLYGQWCGIHARLDALTVAE